MKALNGIKLNHLHFILRDDHQLPGLRVDSFEHTGDCHMAGDVGRPSDVICSIAPINRIIFMGMSLCR